MKSRLNGIPVYQTSHTTHRAQDYNLVRIALKRLGSPLRFKLPRLRTLDLVLEPDAWIIVDDSLNDIPIIAWLDFEDKRRSSLHEDIHCEQRSYHQHALIIVDKALEAMQLILGERLADLPETQSKQVLVFDKKNPVTISE